MRKIQPAKKKDLVSLCDIGLIPSEYHAWFRWEKIHFLFTTTYNAILKFRSLEVDGVETTEKPDDIAPTGEDDSCDDSDKSSDDSDDEVSADTAVDWQCLFWNLFEPCLNLIWK